MTPGDDRTVVTQATLGDGKVVRIEVDQLGGDEEVAARIPSMRDALRTVVDLSKEVANAVSSIKAEKVTVQFGVSLGIESGALCAVIAKGTATANLSIGLELTANDRS